MKKRLELSGKKYGRLEVIARIPNDKWGSSMWLCRCDCGKSVKAVGHRISSGYTRSCGCLSLEMTVARVSKHGHTRNRVSTPEYQTWQNIHVRCYNPRNKSYKYYGARGIQVCCRWHRSNPLAFSNFLHDMKIRPMGRSIDRQNNDSHYMPSNCRWATKREQSLNRRKWKLKK